MNKGVKFNKQTKKWYFQGDSKVVQELTKFKIDRLDEEEVSVPKFEVMAKLEWNKQRLHGLIQDRRERVTGSRSNALRVIRILIERVLRILHIILKTLLITSRILFALCQELLLGFI